ncbi:MAG: DMT family transporter [Prevotella sp.]|nr:DMT family transporter [Prevotella sp.]
MLVSIFQRPLWVSIFALTAAVLWGFAYPLIKLGFGEFAITPDMTGSKMLFAGIRFTVSGLIILTVARATHRPFHIRSTADVPFLVLFSLANTTLHYAFFYFGLSHSAGSRAAILNSLGVFLVVILACVFFKSDRLTPRKILGCAIGIAGVLALNIGGEDSGRFTLLGDGMIILNALCSAIASLMTRGLGQRTDVFVGTGISLALGGILLVIPGLLAGGTLPVVTPLGLLYLLMLIMISTTGFALYNKLLTCNPVGRVAIYNSLIPVVGALSSCLCLGEPFYMKYAVAGSFAALGIYVINKT